MAAAFFKFLNNISRIRWLFIVLVLAYIVRVLLIGAGDFAVYYGASNALMDSKMIYHLPYPVGDSTCEYSYSPFFALILIPLSVLPLWLADLLWLFLNLLALFRIFDLIVVFLGIKKDLTRKEYKWWVFLTLLFSVRFILYNFDLSQVTLILLCGSLESLRLAIKRQWAMSGLVLAVVISIKLMPLVMLPYLFYRRFWQAGLATVGFILILNLTPSVLYTWSSYQNLIKEWLIVLNPMSDDFTINQNVVAESIHSLSGFIPAFFTDEVTRYDLRRHFMNLPTQTMILIMNIARLFFILLTFIFLKTKPFQQINDKKRLFWEFSYLMIAIALIFPHQQKYAFILILPAAAYLLYFILMMKKSTVHLEKPLLYKGLIGLLIIVWLLTTASTDGIIGRTLYEYGQYFKLITWGTMLLIIPLFLAKPDTTFGKFLKFPERSQEPI
jgi:hypothetical protein